MTIKMIVTGISTRTNYEETPFDLDLWTEAAGSVPGNEQKANKSENITIVGFRRYIICI